MYIASIEITRRCDRACVYCQQPKADRDMPVAVFKELIRPLKAEGVEAIALGGGEPTLHAALPEILRACRAVGLPAGLTTNASNPDRIREAVREGLLKQYGVSAGKGQWEALVGLPEAVCNLLLLRDGASDVYAWFRAAVRAGGRCMLMMTYKGRDRKLRPCAREIAITLAWLAEKSREARVALAADDCTRMRLGLSSQCGSDFLRIAIDGSRAPCCFDDCEFYPPRI